MRDQRVKLLLFISLLATLGGVIVALAVGSHFQMGYNDGAFNYDFKVATGHSGAASVLGLIALATGLVGLGLYVLGGARNANEPASQSGAAGSSDFSDFANALRRLTKSNTDEWLGGVCGGLGEHTPLPSWVWRLVFLLLLCCYGTGVLLYVLLWICLSQSRKEAERPGVSSGLAAE